MSVCAAAAVDLEAGAPRVGGADLEAGGEDDAVDLVLDAVEHQPVLGDALDAAALVSTSVTFGRLKVGRYSSLKVGRLQNWRYQGFSASAVFGSLTIASTRARIWFIFLKSASSIIRPSSSRRQVGSAPRGRGAGDRGCG